MVEVNHKRSLDKGNRSGHPPIHINPRPSPSPSVGARAVGSGREGLYGRPRPVPLADILEKHDHLPTPRATIKALPSHIILPRPYGSCGSAPGFPPITIATHVTSICFPYGSCGS